MSLRVTKTIRPRDWTQRLHHLPQDLQKRANGESKGVIGPMVVVLMSRDGLGKTRPRRMTSGDRS